MEWIRNGLLFFYTENERSEKDSNGRNMENRKEIRIILLILKRLTILSQGAKNLHDLSRDAKNLHGLIWFEIFKYILAIIVAFLQ